MDKMFEILDFQYSQSNFIHLEKKNNNNLL